MTFSIEELEAVQNNRFFLIKNEATQKVLHLLGELEKELMNKIGDFSFLSAPDLQLKAKGKIFRGENYRLMPYLILDCPRTFTTETVFAFRSMFRWGHEFSFTLHLQGQALEIFRNRIQQNIFLLKNNDFFFCVNNTPWEYTFDRENYIPLDEMLLKQDDLNLVLKEKGFLKLSRKLELKEYGKVTSFGIETFEKLAEILR